MQIGRLFWCALVEAWNDNVPRLGASLAYYTLFSIAPILLVATAVAGFVFGTEAVQGQIVDQVRGLIGEDGGRAVQALVEGAAHRQSGILATVVGTVTFVLAATGAFLELQNALDTIWRVKPRSVVNVKTFLTARLRSFALVVAVGFLLLVSLLVSAALAAFSHWLGQWGPELPILWNLVNVVLSFAVTTALFGMLYRLLPDVKLQWRHVATGAAVTALLFTLGKTGIGFYLGRSATASSYGAAGSVILLLLWVYYSAQIVLVGAEFTRLYSLRHGAVPKPEDFAERDGSPTGPARSAR